MSVSLFDFKSTMTSNTFTYCYAISIHIQEEDFQKIHLKDPDNGWSSITVYFASQDSIRRYFNNIFMYGGNHYSHTILSAIRKNLWGDMVVNMTPLNTAILHKEQDVFVNAIVNLEMNATYTVNPHIYLFMNKIIINN